MFDHGIFSLAKRGIVIRFCLAHMLFFLLVMCQEKPAQKKGSDVSLEDYWELKVAGLEEDVCGCHSKLVRDTYLDCITSCTDSLISIKMLGQADTLLDTYLDLFPKTGVYLDENLGEIYFQKGKIASQAKDFSSAKKHLSKSISYLPDKSSLLPQANKLLAHTYENLDELRKSYTYMEKYLQYHLQAEETNNSQLALAYYYLGRIGIRVGEMEKAEEMLQFAEELLTDEGEEISLLMGRIYSSLGGLNFESNRYNKALDHFKKAKAIFSDLKKSNVAFARLEKNQENNLAVTSDAMGDYMTAVSIYHQLWQQEEKSPKPSIDFQYFLAFNQALAYKNLENYSEALSWFQLAEKILRQNEENRPWEYASLFTEYADFYQVQDSFRKSIEYSHKSICLLAPLTDSSELFSNPDLSSIDEEQSWELQKAIYHKANTLLKWYEHGKDTLLLRLAMDYYTYIPRLIELMRKSYNSVEDQLFLNQLAEGINTKYAQAINCAHYAWDKQKDPQHLEYAHAFMERHKAMLLLESLLTSRKYRKMRLDQTLVEEGDSIKNRLSQLNSQLIYQQKHAGPHNQSNIQDLNQEIHRLEIAQNQWFAKLEKVSDPSETISETPLVSIKNIQTEILEPESIVISYFLEDSTRLHILSFDQDTTNLEVVALPDTFLRSVRQFIQLVPSQASDDYWYNYTQQGRRLYQLLLGSVEDHFDLDDQRLIIVPDGLLSLLPFEVLLSEDVTSEVDIFKKLPYLAVKHPISYTPSLTLLYEQQNKYKHALADQVLGMAYSSPDFVGPDAETRLGNQNQRFPELKGSFEEVAFIEQRIHGKYRKGIRANKEWFLQNAEQYGILHLAIHGTTSDGLPRLIFRSDYTLNPVGALNHEQYQELYLHEIYNLHLQANLTALSACETGKGFLADGEGILSLARAFTYAGSHSVLMSLWQANDKASAQIMKNYYDQLSQGRNKDEALFEARKIYLDECGPFDAHPASWAAFILQGNREKLDIDLKAQPSKLKYAVIFLFILSIGFILFQNGRKRL